MSKTVQNYPKTTISCGINVETIPIPIFLIGIVSKKQRDMREKLAQQLVNCPPPMDKTEVGRNGSFFGAVHRLHLRERALRDTIGETPKGG
jgi:hypothetical protein